MTADPAAEGVARRRVRARASGKVNLHLSVGPLADDGYHPLATVFQAVDLYETVTASNRPDGAIALTMEWSDTLAEWETPVPLDETNLAWRAAEAVRETYGIVDGVDLHILKGVPVAGGMAGGSADAAAALLACAELWDCGVTRTELHGLAVELGADVPFSLMGHTAIGLGRGEQLSPVMTHGEFHWVFALQSGGLSTPRVFERFDKMVALGEIAAREPAVNTEVMAALIAGDAARLGAALRNDLEAPALDLAPGLAGVIDTMEDAGALGVIVSGSGPTVAGLARSRQHALAIGAMITTAGVADAVVTATGPATGAVLLER
ncbi:4-(cytidine 5'-diphospho)-2-C-methyl-D-erythritol kinase [Demequina sp. TTPB684]|uniref:4-(cytidine 5'-diphospho)-2-C-methyl-D-erythritol kinase n=1 Tax=unclassified Demequina TaxID=2620311 RepID=UPI001CF570FE|nr:4-(cytidine 5'-diphospho)-2-C-methyl-D-erythritol kinase [Demequina sp. TMPB413]MCB2413364.1 4-(cytidine 5'-diphospho)-2-C-methyl-D-erythritol kinase [Demequina sp. TTPB684]UPU87377.1 4-(cytidine 5'-diphospho)-2-C-methyl-D-erythritol kinase [Demequina sp. TMPB413]